MSLIRCPSCQARVSSRAERCRCGQLIRGASAEAAAESRRRERARLRGRWKLQLLLASTLFVAGALWVIGANVGAIGTPARWQPLPLLLLGLGGLWYLVARARLWSLDR